MIQLPPTSTLFPYTTLFRSIVFRPQELQRFVPRVRARQRHVPVRVARVVVELDEPAHEQPRRAAPAGHALPERVRDRKSTRLNSSHMSISYAVFCLKKKKK